MGAAALGCGAVGLWLLFGGNPGGFVPMPGGCGAAFGLSAVALCVYFYRFLGQLCRPTDAFTTMLWLPPAANRSCPPCPCIPSFPLRPAAVCVSLPYWPFAIFALCGALGMALSMFYAGAIEFWHAWGWFGYSA